MAVNGNPKHLQQALEGSLKRLRLDTIDLYQLHRIDNKVPFEDIFNWLKKVQQQGLLKHIGLSEVNVEQIKKAQQFVEVVSVQNMYSLITANGKLCWNIVMKMILHLFLGTRLMVAM